MAKIQPTKEEIERRRKKTVSVRRLAEQIVGLRQKVTRDMKSEDEKTRLTATAVALMDCTAERVGNDDSAGDDHVGVTGFKKKNVSVSGNKVTLTYVGKSGVDHEREFTDERIATVFKECLKRCKSPDDFVLTTSDGYKVKADRVNRYLREYGVTAKDIRGYAANHMVIESLKKREIPKEESDRKKVILEVLDKVAERVGHGKPTLRKHYLLPGLEDDYIKHGKIQSIKKASQRTASVRVAEKFYMRLSEKESYMNESKRIVEDERPKTPFEGRIRDSLGFFSIQHEYVWAPDAIEKFFLYLASVADVAAIQNAGWYRYGTSSMQWDKCNWRVVVPDRDTSGSFVVIDCGGVLNEASFVMTMSIFETREDLSGLSFTGDTDPWRRSMKWSMRLVSEMMEWAGADEILNGMERRMRLVDAARPLMIKIRQEVSRLHDEIFGEPGDLPKQLVLMVGDWNLRKGKIGSYKYDGELPFGLMTLAEKAFEDPEMVAIVLAHELAHAAIGNDVEDDHGPEFRELATRLGIPKRYQD